MRGLFNMIIYLVLYNGKVSQEGYTSLSDAIDFVKSRGTTIRKSTSIGYDTYTDAYGNIYQITDILVHNISVDFTKMSI